MPKWRKLHVKILESLDVNDMPDDFARLFWVLLPLILCREGRGLDYPIWIKSKVFPLREDVTNKQIEDAMDWFEKRGMIMRYKVDGRKYFQVVNFREYQGNTTREADSPYPAPPDNDSHAKVTQRSCKGHAKVMQRSCNSHELVTQRSCLDVDVDSDVDVDVDSDSSRRRVEKSKEFNIYELYEQEIGIITPKTADLLKEAEQEYPAPWIAEAIGIAVERNARNWRYCEAILKRWKAEGKDSGRARASPGKDTDMDVITKVAKELSDKYAKHRPGTSS
jgi:DnaD/phage-associated family protein